MKNISFFLLLSFMFLSQSSWAQPTFYFSPDFQLVDLNDQVCYDVKTADFTDIIGVSFSVRWNPGVLNNASITPSELHPELIGLSMADFSIDNTEGYLTFDWSNGEPCDFPDPSKNVTLDPDDQTLFEICFDAIGIYGNHTDLEITDDPVDIYVKRDIPGPSGCGDIGDIIYDGFCSIGTEPLMINISSTDGFQGETVCVDFTVENFDNLISTQYYIFWDPNILLYENSFTSGIPGFGPGNISFTNGGLGVISWNAVGGPISVPDGTQILQMCFTVLGNCGQNSAIWIDDNGDEKIEIIDAVTTGTNGTNIGLIDNPGEASVNCFSPDGINLDIEDKNVCPGETFTVDINVENFEEIITLQYGLKWNPSIIQLTNTSGDGISFPNGEPCFQMDSPGSLKTFPTEGRIEVDWNGGFFSCCDMNNGELLMRLHFRAIGPGATNSTISVIQDILVDECPGQVDNIGINNDNGLVSICELDNPTLVIASQDANPGENICLAVTTQDFEDILTTEYTISWEPNFLSLTGLQNFNLAGLNNGDFDFSQADALGNLGLMWNSNSAVSVPDGTTIFELCFDVMGDPDSCSSVQFTENMVFTNVESSLSSGTNVGLNGQSAEVCALNPFDVAIQADNVYGVPGEHVQINLSAENFMQLRKLQFTLGWKKEIIQYDSLTSTGVIPNFSNIHYNEAPQDINNGVMGIDWTTNNINGVTVPDGQAFVTLHFTILGDPGDCSGVKIGEWVNPIVTNSALTGSANLGIEPIDGSVCVNQDFITIVQVDLTDVECPSVPSGGIDLTISGGSGDYDFNWEGSGVVQNVEDQIGLNPGFYSVTVSDAQNPSLIVDLDFQVLLSPNAPIADAGPDTTFSCSTSIATLTLNGSGSSSTGVNYFWENEPGTLPGFFQGNIQDVQNPTVIGGSSYILTVTQPSTGCVVSDTVSIGASLSPNPEIQDNNIRTLTCERDTVILNGGSPQNLFEFEWIAGPGGQIVPDSDTSMQPMVIDTGWYYLRMYHPVTGCEGIDSIFVDENKNDPTANAGDDGMLGCIENETTLDGGNSTLNNTIFEWIPTGTGQICGAIDQMTAEACAAGIYQLIVTDTINGCTAMDEVEVESDMQNPMAIAGPPDTAFNCIVSEIMLDGGASSQGNDIDYFWLNSAGDTVSYEVTHTTTVTDIFTLVVLDNSNGCQATSNIAVEEDKDLPFAFVDTTSFDLAITCDSTALTLNNIGSSVGPQFIYEWMNPVGDLVGTDTFLTVTEPGTYMLFVKDNDNECVNNFEVIVKDKNDPIQVAAGNDTTIDCLFDTPLTGSFDSNSSNINIQWSGPGQPNCILNSTTLNATVECPGEYILMVQDMETGCLGSDTLFVTADTVAPVISAGDDTVFPCNVDMLPLEGTSDVSDITVEWVNTLGNEITNETALDAMIEMPGVYTLTVTSNENNCTSESSVIISAPDLPTALIEGPTEVDCAMPNATLTGINSTANVFYLWETTNGSIPGGQETMVEVNVPAGDYTLTVTDTNGCQGTATHIIDGSIGLPNADAGEDSEIGCDEDNVLLDGSGSDAGLNYLWTDANGMILGNDLTVTVSESGVYTLAVTNPDNFCVSESTVNVTLATTGDIPAEASFDHDPCAVEAMLMGNLPAGATGLWTSSSGANIADPTAETTLTTGLSGGENTFFWSLSLGRCDNYSTTQTSIVIDQSVPSPMDDFAEIMPLDQGTIAVNVFENDEFDPLLTSLNVVSNNVPGTIDFTPGGTITYTKERCYIGTIEIEYELCNTNCPDLCKSAILTIEVFPDPEEGCDEVPNGITPNGDGVNDELIFDQLLNTEIEYPNNELIIFNRWGDVVYKAQPYMNDWNGVNDAGDELPNATYYYVFRLDVSNSLILRGDVTILD